MKFPKCTLGSVISPGSYIVVSKNEKHFQEIKLLEQSIMKTINLKRKGHELLKSSQKLVAVKTSKNDEVLRRGIIQKNIGQSVYEVFLIDYGYSVELDESQIHFIDDKNFSVEPLSFLVNLHELHPVELSYKNEIHNQKNYEQWSVDSKNFVKQLFQNDVEIKVESIFIEGRIVHGDLHLKNCSSSSYISLRKILVSHKFAYCLGRDPLIQGDCFETLEENFENLTDTDVKDIKKEPAYENMSLKKDIGGPESKLKSLHDYREPFVLLGNSAVKPVNNFKELPVLPSMIKNLKSESQLDVLSPLQRWAIPSIHEENDVILIGKSRFEKSLSYVLPLINNIQNKKSTLSEMEKGSEPFVIILCSNSSFCQSVLSMCHILLGERTEKDKRNSDIRMILSHGEGFQKNNYVELTNGCHVLISTPNSLLRLSKKNLITFKRLTCLVLNEVDIIGEEPFKNSVRIILEKVRISTKSRSYQKIFCGERWTSGVENLVKSYMTSYVLIIDSHMEVAVYTKAKPYLFLIDSNYRTKFLLGKIKDQIGQTKILIVCESVNDAIFVHNFFKQKKIDSLIAHDNIMSSTLEEIRLKWKFFSSYPVLVSTDRVLHELGIRGVEILVHYSLPSKSKTNFFYRYSVLLDDVEIQQNNIRSKVSSKEPVNIILVEDKNYFQLPHIVDFVKRLGGIVPNSVVEKCKEIRDRIEMGKKNSPLCREVLAFGCCRNQNNCPQRHVIFQEIDSNKTLPSSGWIKFSLLKVHDVSWFSARLLEHIENGKNTKMDVSYLKMSLWLKKFFAFEDNRKMHPNPKIGDTCAVKYDTVNQKAYCRGQIIDYVQVDKFGKPSKVNVRLLDQGYIVERKVTELYNLPENLSKYPPACVDVRIAGFQPLDLENKWNEFSIFFFRDLIAKKLEKNQYWLGKIVLTINNTFFLESVMIKQFLPKLNTHVIDLVIEKELITNGIVIKNEKHIPSLMKLVTEGLPENLLEEKDVKKIPTPVVQPQWAMFNEEVVPVRFLSARDTSTIFLRHEKFEAMLGKFEALCRQEAIKKKSHDFKLSPEMYCLAKLKNRWSRGRIEFEEEHSFGIFFIDYGESLSVEKSEIVPIPETLLAELPCQAVECSLVGVKENQKWSSEVLETIYDFSNNGEDYLNAYIICEDSAPEISKGRKYRLNLVNSKGVSLNKFLIDRKMVDAKESEREFLRDKSVNSKIFDVNKKNKSSISENDPENHAEENTAGIFFDKLTDDFFKEEHEILFLEEFSSKFFREVENNLENTASLVSMKSNSEQMDKIDFGKETSVKHFEVTDEDNANFCQSSKKKLNAGRTLLNSNEKIIREEFKGGELKNPENILTPRILWFQNHSEIKLKILLANVNSYKIVCSITNFMFSCQLTGKFYSFDLKLYGGVRPESTKIFIRPFYVIVILKKTCFLSWPRLHLDGEKNRRIGLDLENLIDKENISHDKTRMGTSYSGSAVLKENIVNEYSDSEISESSEFDEYEFSDMINVC